MAEFQARLLVRLRPGVLDPAGQAVQAALGHLGFSASQVQIGKLIELSLAAESREAAEETVRAMAQQLLVNPVLEDFELEVCRR